MNLDIFQKNVDGLRTGFAIITFHISEPHRLQGSIPTADGQRVLPETAAPPFWKGDLGPDIAFAANKGLFPTGRAPCYFAVSEEGR